MAGRPYLALCGPGCSDPAHDHARDANQTTQRPPKSTESIILATLPEPDDNDAHDGYFIGQYDPEHGVVTVTFTRNQPGMSPDECEEYDVPDEGDSSVQLVEREALIKALTKITRYSDAYWRETLARVLFD